MTTSRDRAQKTVDAVFGPRGSGVDGFYLPIQGAPAPCRLIVNGADREVEFGAGRPVSAGETIEVRKSEVAAPVRYAQFKIDEQVYKIVSDPVSDDPDRLVWKATVA